MNGKASKFDFGEAENATVEPAPESARPRKAGGLGPMASAIRDSAVGDQSPRQAADPIETLELAVRQKKLLDASLDLRLVPVDAIIDDHLTRDRLGGDAEALGELIASIRAHGLENPVRLEADEAGELLLVQGSRRLRAFRVLAKEDPDRFSFIPALISAKGVRELAYRRMIDENLIREDVGPGELAVLALAYADEAGMTVEDACATLFQSAHRRRRHTIAEACRILTAAKGALRHPAALTRNLIETAARRVRDGGDLCAALAGVVTAEDERAALETFARSAPRKATRGLDTDSAPIRFRIDVKAAGRRLEVSLSSRKLVVSGQGLDDIDVKALKAFLISQV